MTTVKECRTDYEQQAAHLMARLDRDLSSLANSIMHAWLSSWVRKFPRCRVEIAFGMGSELVKIGGQQVCSWDCDNWPIELNPYTAIDTVQSITRFYTLACPDDVRYEGHV